MGATDPIGLATINSLGRNIAQGADEKTALRSFDAYFMGEMLKQSAPQNPTGMLDGGQAGRMYQDHLYQELARIVAESGGLGIAEALEGQLDRRGQTEVPADETAPVDPEIAVEKEATR